MGNEEIVKELKTRIAMLQKIVNDELLLMNMTLEQLNAEVKHE